MSSEALKPCPFCGGAVVGEPSVCDYIVLCRPCGLKMRRNSEHRAAAVAAWNRRSPSPAVLALVEACKTLHRVALNGGYGYPIPSEIDGIEAALAAVEREIGDHSADASKKVEGDSDAHR